MIVYGSSMSPFVRKVLVFAAEKGIAVEARRVAPRSTDPAFLAASPLGKVPALEDGNFRISDSSAIVAYLDALQPAPVLIPLAPQARARVIWFEEFADGELFGGPARTIFANRRVLPSMGHLGDLAAAKKAEFEELPPLFDYLEGQMTLGAYLVEDCFSLADIAVASVLANILHCDVEFDRWPGIKTYAEQIHRRPSFAFWLERERAFFEARKAGYNGPYSHDD